MAGRGGSGVAATSIRSTVNWPGRWPGRRASWPPPARTGPPEHFRGSRQGSAKHIGAPFRLRSDEPQFAHAMGLEHTVRRVAVLAGAEERQQCAAANGARERAGRVPPRLLARTRPTRAGRAAGRNAPPHARVGRAELATLAGEVSVEYLARLEQGRDRNPSPQVITALADAPSCPTSTGSSWCGSSRRPPAPPA